MEGMQKKVVITFVECPGFDYRVRYLSVNTIILVGNIYGGYQP